MELWDIYSREGQKIGRTIERGRPLSPGEYHLVVHIWPVDELGRYLIQKRAAHLNHLPGIWAATGGSAVVGEDSVTAAIRETREELRLETSPDEMTRICRLVRQNSLADLWTLPLNSSIAESFEPTEEVAEIRWAHPQEILFQTEVGGFHDYGDEYFDILFGSAK